MQELIITGIFGISIGLISKILFDWFKMGKNKNGNGKSLLNKINQDVKWIKDIHDKTDTEGLPLWYIPREWKKTLDVVSERTMESNIYLKEIRDNLKANNILLEKMINKLE